jgi:hypothetical protein
MKIAILGSWREGERIKQNYLFGFAENILEDYLKLIINNWDEIKFEI